jgi:hypothetical protein
MSARPRPSPPGLVVDEELGLRRSSGRPRMLEKRGGQRWAQATLVGEHLSRTITCGGCSWRGCTRTPGGATSCSCSPAPSKTRYARSGSSGAVATDPRRISPSRRGGPRWAPGRRATASPIEDPGRGETPQAGEPGTPSSLISVTRVLRPGSGTRGYWEPCWPCCCIGCISCQIRSQLPAASGWRWSGSGSSSPTVSVPS